MDDAPLDSILIEEGNEEQGKRTKSKVARERAGDNSKRPREHGGALFVRSLLDARTSHDAGRMSSLRTPSLPLAS